MIPAFDQPSEDGGEGLSTIQGAHTGDVLPNNPAGPCAASKAAKFERQVTTVIIQSTPESRDGEGLAGSSSNEKVNWAGLPSFDFREIAKVPDSWPSMRQNCTGKFIDFSEGRRFPSKRMPSH
jgi:hypothetical protein